MTEKQSLLSADSPVQHPTHDELEYAPFAQQLAKAILRMSPTDGIVMSINGSWGSGKTTVLNFVLHYLRETQPEEQPIILRFNPWWFSGREDLTRLLIGQLRALLGDKDYGEIKGKLADLADLVSKIPLIPGGEAGEFFANKLRGELDLVSLKEKIGELLLSKNKKILVIIDDIDRLAIEEIRDLFRTIKATANFPNVIYLLAFETKVVVDALERGYVSSGQRYLEKIVQVPFELPIPDRTVLRQMFLGKLNQILTNTPEELFDENYWGNTYFDGIDAFINTPREITRLINTLRATYPAVEGEVNPVDFVAIESLRVFHPVIYDIVRRNETLLTESLSSYEKKDEIKSIFEGWLDQASSDREKIEKLLCRLFPKFSAVFNQWYDNYPSSWRKQLRICSSDIFQNYFRFSISSDVITISEIKLLLDHAKDKNTFGNKLIEYANRIQRNGMTRLRFMLERLEDYTKDDIPEDNIKPIIDAFFDVGDDLLKENDRQGIFDFGNDTRIGRIIFQLIRRLTEEKRFQILYEAIENGSALSTITRQVAVFGQQHGKYGSNSSTQASDLIVNAEHLTELEQLVLGKIQDAAGKGTLLTSPELLSILYRWRDWTNDQEEVKRWVTAISKSDENLIKLIECCKISSTSFSSGDAVAKKKYSFKLEYLESFIDLEDIARRVKEINNDAEILEEHKILTKEFLNYYEQYCQQKNQDEDD